MDEDSETVTCGARRTRAAALNRFTGWVPRGMYSPWITTMSSGHDVSECVSGTSGLPPMFHHNNRGKIIKNRQKA
jgi:hypothetical protein